MNHYRLSELADYCGATLAGDENTLISGISTLQNAKSGDLSFLANPGYIKFLQETKATAVILSPQHAELCHTHALIMDNPYLGYAKISHLFNVYTQVQSGISDRALISEQAVLERGVSVGPHAVIESGVNIGENVHIGAGCYIGRDTQIGANTVIYPNVSVYHKVILGQRCLLHSGVVIGSDGFGFAPHADGWEKIAQIGGVILGDDVEVGANTTIDRGALDDTLIGNGVKLDNQIQIGHNVCIGDHSVLAANTAIAGSTTLGKKCVIGGSTGIVGHVHLADGVQASGMSMITKSFNEPVVLSSGIPAQSNREWKKNIVHLRRIDGLVKRVKYLEVRLNQQENEKGKE